MGQLASYGLKRAILKLKKNRHEKEMDKARTD
jgi:hypothetical protein